MQQIIEKAQMIVHDFIESRDHTALILHADVMASAVVSSLLGELEKSEMPHVLWLLPEPVGKDLQGYVQSAVNMVSSRISFLAPHFIDEGLECPPEVPSDIARGGMTPIERMRSLIQFTRNIFVGPHGLAIWAFLPSEINAPAYHQEFFSRLLEHDWPNPWSSGTRIVVRSDLSADTRSQIRVDNPRVRAWTFDMRPAALRRAMIERASDEEAPMSDRMQNLLMLASDDAAHDRLLEAVEKYTLLVRYYRGVEQPALAAIALMGLGDIQRKRKVWEDAKEKYKESLGLALQAGATGLPVMINLSLSLAGMHADQKAYSEAIEYYEGAAQLAKGTGNLFLLAHCCEEQSKLHLILSEYKDALIKLQEGVLICRDLAEEEMQMRLLEAQRDLYKRAKKKEEVAVIERDILILRERGPEVLRETYSKMEATKI